MNHHKEFARPRHDTSSVGVADSAAGKSLVRAIAGDIGGSGARIRNPRTAMVPGPLMLGPDASGFVAKFGLHGMAPWGTQTVLVAGIWGCATCVTCLSGSGSTCEYWARRPPSMLDGDVSFSDSGISGMTTTSVRQRALMGDEDRFRAAPHTDTSIAPNRAIDLALPHLRAAATVAVIAVGGIAPVVVQVLRASTAYRILALDADAARPQAVGSRETDNAMVARATPGMEQTPYGLSVRSELDIAGMLANAIVARYGALVAAGLGTGSFLIGASAPPSGVTARDGGDL